MNDPRVIIADEPTGNLDSETGAGIIKMLKKLNAAGATVIVVTHDEGIAKHSKRIARIKDGLIEKITRVE